MSTSCERTPFDPAGGTPEVAALWEELLADTQKRLLDYPRALDVVQEAFSRTLKRIKKNPGEEELKLSRPYLRQTIRNILLGEHRDTARRVARETEYSKPESQPSAADLAMWRESEAKTKQAMASLSPQDRELLESIYLDGHSFAAVARALGVRETSVRSRALRARRRLARELDREYSGRQAWVHSFALALGRPEPIVASPLGGLRHWAVRAIGLGGVAGLAWIALPGLHAFVGDDPAAMAARSEGVADERRGEVLAAERDAPQREALAIHPSLPAGDSESTSEKLGVPPIRFSVVSSEAGHAHLSNVEVWRTPRRDPEHPGDFKRDRLLAGGLTSPFDLLADSSAEPIEHLRIGSPGHGWVRHVVVRGSPGEHVLWLEPAADLRIRLQNHHANGPSVLTVRRQNDSPLPNLVALLVVDQETPDEVVLSGVPAGAYGVELRRQAQGRPVARSGLVGYARPPGFLLASRQIRHRLGQETVVALDAQAQAAPAAGVRTSVVLFLPPMLLDQRVSVRLLPRFGCEERAFEMGSVDIGALTSGGSPHRFDPISIPVGSYDLKVLPLLHYETVEVRSPGEIQIVVPEVSELVVHNPKRESTGDVPLLLQREIDTVHHPLATQGILDPASGDWRFTLVPGVYRAGLDIGNGLPASATLLTADAGRDEEWLSIGFEPEPAVPYRRIEVWFREGSLVRPQEWLPFEVTGVGHSGFAIGEPALEGERGNHVVWLPFGYELRDSWPARPFFELLVSEPGNYLFGGFELPPYGYVPERVVHVTDTGPNEVIYDLVRRE